MLKKFFSFFVLKKHVLFINNKNNGRFLEHNFYIKKWSKRVESGQKLFYTMVEILIRGKPTCYLVNFMIILMKRIE